MTTYMNNYFVKAFTVKIEHIRTYCDISWGYKMGIREGRHTLHHRKTSQKDTWQRYHTGTRERNHIGTPDKNRNITETSHRDITREYYIGTDARKKSHRRIQDNDNTYSCHGRDRIPGVTVAEFPIPFVSLTKYGSRVQFGVPVPRAPTVYGRVKRK